MPPSKFLPKFKVALLLSSLALAWAGTGRAEVLVAPSAEKPDVAKNDAPQVDFQSEDTFIDVPDALKSKQFVQRAVLSSAIKETARFGFGKMIVAQSIGYDAVFQPANRGPFAKYASGLLGLSGGYVSEGGHAIELGVNLSAVSNLFLDYRYIIRPTSYAFWPFLGFGVGTAVGDLNLTDPPPAGKAYLGSNEMLFATLGFLIPVMDVGLKAEARFQFYGLSRLVLTTTVGVNFFL